MLLKKCSYWPSTLMKEYQGVKYGLNYQRSEQIQNAM